MTCRLVILGSTGSIGRQTLDVVARHRDAVEVVALAAHSNDVLVAEQARTFGVTRVALANDAAALRAREALPDAEVDAGADAVEALAALAEADVVLNALVGAAGLRASIAALRSGKRLALANKESLVAGGDLLMSLVRDGAELIPVDSEHSALFQCILGEQSEEISRLWLTASGGPFRGMSREDLSRVTVEQALRHPRWSMGPKITIDSATLMNKGLEVIEAHHLFGVPYDRVSVVLHPQSIVHSMIEFVDGSVKAHLGPTDMRIPIQYALSYPARWSAPLPPLDLTALGQLDFSAPDADTFGCLALAFEAGREGGTAPAVLNAANEVAVAAFLRHRIGLLDIERVVRAVLEGHESRTIHDADDIEYADAEARRQAETLLPT